MFDRSRAFIYVCAPLEEVLAAQSSWLRRFGYRPRATPLPAGYQGTSGVELRELIVRESTAAEGFHTLAVEDVQNVLFFAYALSQAMPKAAVLVSRAYKYGDWCFKAYLDRDCLVKVGDDPDHELSWLTLPLTPDRVAEVAGKLAPRNAAFERFLGSVAKGQAEPEALRSALELPPLTEGFAELRDRGSAGRYVLFVASDSPLWR